MRRRLGWRRVVLLGVVKAALASALLAFALMAMWAHDPSHHREVDSPHASATTYQDSGPP